MDNEKETKGAGFWVRFISLWIDVFVISFILLSLCFPLSFVLDNVEKGSTFWYIVGGFMLLLFVSVPIAYASIMEASNRKGTIGKMCFSLKVIGHNQDEITMSKSIIRNVVKYFCLIFSFPFILLFLVVPFSQEQRGVHDLIAGTKVIKEG